MNIIKAIVCGAVIAKYCATNAKLVRKVERYNDRIKENEKKLRETGRYIHQLSAHIEEETY